LVIRYKTQKGAENKISAPLKSSMYY